MTEQNRTPAEKLAKATDGLIECLLEFGEEAHRYCAEHLYGAQSALTLYEQSICQHNPKSLPDAEGKYCVKCGLRIIEEPVQQ